MLFLFLEVVTETKAKVGTIHYKPEELSADDKLKGVEVSIIPNPQVLPLKRADLYVNPQTKEMWCEYVDVPPSPDDEIAQLKAELAQVKADLVVTQTATDFLLFSQMPEI